MWRRLLVLVLALLTGSVLAFPAPQAHAITASAAATSAASVPIAVPDRLVPVAPTRVIDTATKQGLAGPLRPRQPVTVSLTGVAGVPATGVAAVVVNLNLMSRVDTSLRAWASGTAEPATVVLSNDERDRASELAVLPVGSNGRTMLSSAGGLADLTVDVVGWFPSGSDFKVVAPARVVDSRSRLQLNAKVRPGTAAKIALGGRGALPASGVGSVLIDVTTVDATARTSWRMWAAGSPRPDQPIVDAGDDDRSTSLALVPVAADGSISVESTGGVAHLVIDVLGWFPTDAPTHAVAPVRVYDTGRPRLPSARITATKPAVIKVLGTGGVPATDVGSVLVRFGAVRPTLNAVLTMWTTGAVKPAVPNLRVGRDSRGGALALVVPGADGTITLGVDTGSTDAWVDVVGWVAIPAVPPPPGWAVRPGSVLLDKGETRVVSLVPLDEAGNPSASKAIASGVTFEATGGGVTYRSLGNNQVELKAGQTADTLILRVSATGSSTPATLNASVVVLQPGVQEIADDAVVFPVPYLSKDKDQTAALGSLAGPGTIASFTTAEVGGRMFVPAIADGDDSTTHEGVRTPLVLKGAPPATGTLLLTAGGTGVTGRVVEPAGLPTITRGEFSLVSVERVDLGVLYDDIRYRYSETEFHPMTLVDAPVSNLVAPSSSVRSLAGVPATTPPVQGCDKTVGFAELRVPQPTYLPSIRLGDNFYDRRSGTARFVIELKWDEQYEYGALLELFAELACSRKVMDLAQFVEALPENPIDPFSTIYLESDIAAEIAAKILAGPRIDIGFGVKFTVVATLGFERIDGQSRNLSDVRVENAGLIQKWPSLASFNLKMTGWQLDLTGGVFARARIGLDPIGSVRIPGINDNFPEKWEFAEAKVGPRAAITIENIYNPAIEKKSGSSLKIELIAEAKAKSPMSEVARRFGVNLGVAAVLLDKKEALATAYAAPAVTALASRASSSDSTDFKPFADGATLYVSDNDSLEIKTTLGDSITPINAYDVYAVDPTLADDDMFDLFTSTGSPTSTLFEGTIPKSFCIQTAEAGGKHRPVEFRAVGTTAANFGGWQLADFVPVYLGSFKVQCADGHLEFDRPSVDLNGGLPATPNVSTYGPTVDLLSIDPGDWSSWLTVTLGKSTVSPKTPDEADVIPVTIAHKGAKTCQAPRTAVVSVSSGHRGTTSITVNERDYCTLRFGTDSASGNGTKVHTSLITAGQAEDHYGQVSAPSWATLSPAANVLPISNTDQTIPVDVVFSERPPTCTFQPAISGEIKVTTSLRGDATLKVVWPGVQAKKCSNSKRKLGGDPHITTADGVYFDAQVVGEYVYARSEPGAATPFEVRGRQELTTPGGIAAANPTSATALAVRSGDHTIELYVRDAQGQVMADPVLYIDGKKSAYADGTTSEAAPGFTVTFHDSAFPTFGIVGPGFNIEATTSSLLDLAIETDGDQLVRGLLGSSDGDGSNDFTTSDGSQQFTRDQIATHGAALYTFTDSWRITNPAESMFTVAYDGFADPNPVYSAEALAPFRAQVASLFTSLAPVCDVAAGTRSYLLDSLAFELSLGRTIDQVANYTCTYVVTGTVLGGTTPAWGAIVKATMPGFTACSAAVRPTGTFSCALRPDPTAVASAPASLPFVADLRVVSPAGDLLGTGTAAWATKAVIGDGDEIADVALSIDESLLPSARLHGTMARSGAALAGPVYLDIAGYGADGAARGETSVGVMPGADGSYDVTVPLSMGTTRLIATARVAVTGSVNPKVDVPLTLGRNDIPFSFDFLPMMIRVSGHMRDATGASLSGDQLIFVTSSSGTRTLPRFGYPVHLAADGSYTIDIEVPEDSDKVVVQGVVGVIDDDYVTKTLTGLIRGVNPVTIDVDYAPPIITASGTLLDSAGRPITSTQFVRFVAYHGTSELRRIGVPVTPSASGVYSVSMTLPLASNNVDVTAMVGDFASDWPTVNAVVTAGPNAVTVDVSPAATTLVLSGTMTDNGVPRTGPMSFTISARDAAGAGLATIPMTAQLDAAGTFTLTTVLPQGTATVVVHAADSLIPSDQTELTYTGITAGVNTRVFNSAQVPTILHLTGHVDRWGSAWANGAGFAAARFPTGFQDDRTVAWSTDANGDYVLDIAVPHGASSVSLVLFVRTPTSDAFMDLFAVDLSGLVPGVNARRVDVTSAERTLTVSGRITRNGVVPAGTVPMNFFFQLDLGGRTYSYTPTRNVTMMADGTYSVSLPIPTAANRVTVANPWGGQAFVLEPGDQSVVFDSITADTVAVQGRIRIDGIPVDVVRLGGTFFDADGNPVGDGLSEFVYPGTADGSYVVSLGGIPSDAVRVDYTLQYTFGTENTFVSFTSEITPDSGVLTEFNRTVQTVRLHGRFVDDNGDPVTASNVIAGGELFDAGSASLGTITQPVSSGTDGLFDVTLTLPEEAVVLALDIGRYGTFMTLPGIMHTDYEMGDLVI